MPTARFIELWNSNETRLRRLTTETMAFREGRPFNPVAYASLVARLNVYTAGTLFTMNLDDLSQLISGPLQMAKRSQLQSKLVEQVDPPRAEDLVNKTKAMLLALDAFVQGASVIRTAATSAGLTQVRTSLRGLGILPAIPPAVIGGAVVISVVILLALALVAAAQTVAIALVSATVFCVNRGCSVNEYQDVLNTVANTAVKVGSANPVNQAINTAAEGTSSLILWGGLLVLGSAIAYGVWKAEGSPVPGKVTRLLNGLGAGDFEYEMDQAKLREKIREGPREADYINTSEFDNMYPMDNLPVPAARRIVDPRAPIGPRAGAPRAAVVATTRTPEPTRVATPRVVETPRAAETPRETPRKAPKTPKSSVDGQLVASYSLRKGVNPAADMDTKAWKLACRAIGLRTTEGGCAKPEMLVDENCTQSRKIVFGQELSASDRDKIARALRGGGYSVEIK